MNFEEVWRIMAMCITIGAFLLISYFVGLYYGEIDIRNRWNRAAYEGPDDLKGSALLGSIGIAIVAGVSVVISGIINQYPIIPILLAVWLTPAVSFLIFHTTQYLWGREGGADSPRPRMVAEMVGLVLAWPVMIPYIFWCLWASRKWQSPRLPH